MKSKLILTLALVSIFGLGNAVYASPKTPPQSTSAVSTNSDTSMVANNVSRSKRKHRHHRRHKHNPSTTTK